MILGQSLKEPLTILSSCDSNRMDWVYLCALLELPPNADFPVDRMNGSGLIAGTICCRCTLNSVRVIQHHGFTTSPTCELGRLVHINTDKNTVTSLPNIVHVMMQMLDNTCS